MDNSLFDNLKQLVLSVKSTIDEKISNGTIQHEEELFFRWKVN
jgi:hypothetical protein